MILSKNGCIGYGVGCVRPWLYLNATYFEIEGKEPKPAQLKKIIEHAKEQEIKAIFVQPQFSTKNAKLVTNEIDGRIIFTDPLAEEWHTNLKEVARKFEAALK
jgi:zinc transport system substrate-binding protein